ncbi:MAG: hypothetical protein RDV48_25015 [Candidatus Eremiobacteraeota bacterium]|nr:hypothetical protein [Candidatus Eremiobacteraeota bacterium]
MNAKAPSFLHALILAAVFLTTLPAYTAGSGVACAASAPGESTRKVQELYEGHNDVTKKRLNLIFVGARYHDLKEFRRIACELIALKGENARGLLQMKPYNDPGCRYYFNFWIYDTVPRIGKSPQTITNEDVWQCLSGTLNTVMEDFSRESGRRFTRGDRDICAVLLANVDPRENPRYGYGGGSFGRTATFTVWHTLHPWFSWDDMIVTHVHELMHSIPEFYDEISGPGSIYDDTSWSTADGKGQFFIPGSAGDRGGITKERFIRLSPAAQYDYVKRNCPWRHLMGNGYGAPGVMDSIDEEAYRTGRKFIPRGSHEPLMDLEIGIFEGGRGREKHIYRSTKNSLMNYPYGLIPGKSLGLGLHLEQLARKRLSEEFQKTH